MDLSRLEDLFHRCCELPPEEREALLARECGESGELAAKVRELLAHAASRDREETDGLAPFVARPAEPQEHASLLGRSIGGYDVERTVASGGMGTVFTAIQRSTKRRVALKTLKPELMGAALVRRFALEVEVLGRLHHPNIAQVFDGGAETLDSATIPYFAMEFVPNARPIHVFARERALEIEPTLGLFMKVCRGVEHAHLHGVIHRDLKPENILIDGEEADAEPKVIDFGIARFSEEGAGGTLLTSPGQIIGTLETMSPEQARGAADEIDVRTDVYALGVVLYQMLTGEAPLAVRGKSIPDALRTILEAEPASLSKMRKGIRPELDAIVLKSLAKERGDRYESARAFREDVLAFVEGRTVSARAPGTLALLAMTIRRHRAILIPAALVFVVAIAAAVVSTRFAIEANRRSDEVSRLAYRASVSAASAALANAQVTAAEKHLSDAPVALRGWEWRHLASRLHEEIASFDADRGDDDLDCFAIGEKSYATGSVSDSTVRIWNASTGVLEHAFRLGGVPQWVAFDGDSAIFARDWSPDGGAFHRWSIDGRGHEEWPVPPEIDNPNGDVPWNSSAGTRISVTPRREPHELFVYDVAAREMIARGTPPQDDFIESALDPSAARLAVSGRYANAKWTIEILELPALGRVRALEGFDGEPGRFRFSPDGRFIVAGTPDRQINVWDLQHATSAPAYTIAMKERGQSPCISGDGKILAMSSIDWRIHYFELASGTRLGTLDGSLERGASIEGARQRGRRFQAMAMDFLRGTNLLYTAADRSPVKVWDLSRRTLRELTRHKSFVYPVEICGRSGFVLSGGWDGWVGARGSLRWTDLATGHSIGQLGPPGIIILEAEISPSETEALVSVYNFADSQAGGAPAEPNASRPSPLIAPKGSGLVARISMISGEVLATHPFPEVIENMTTDPGYRRVVCGDVVGNIRVIDLASGEVLHETGQTWSQQADAATVAWSPDGRWIAVVRTHRRVEIWDASTYEVVAEVPGHERVISSIAFDAASGRMVTASDDLTLKVWSVPDGRELARLVGHGGSVLCVGFDPSGTRIVSGGRGGEVRFWDAETYEPLTSMTLHNSYVYDLEWTADGQTLVTGSGDGMVGVWESVPIRHRAAAREEREAIAARVAPEVEAAFAAGGDPVAIWNDLVGEGGALDREAQVRWQEILERSLARANEAQ